MEGTNGKLPEPVAFAALSTHEQLNLIYSLLYGMNKTLERYKPLLDRYETAAQASSFLGARRAMRHG